ncbi:MAG: uroporphyrinogen-III synthase [Deltaproteobacteria bacterium]|nr:uroporphyrinogen-III synthase [Deltaproteobacteria bacterium]
MPTTTVTVTNKPLLNRRIVVTRPRTQSRGFAETLEQYGAEVILFPTIETVPVAAYARLDAALEQIGQYHWLLFTSVNGVKFFTERLTACGKSAETLRHLKVATIGPETARAVNDLSLQVHAVPAEYRAEALVTVLGEVRGQRILLPRAAEARYVLPKELRALGAQVDEIPVYETRRPQSAETEKVRALLSAAKIDLVTFTSSSTVRNFVAAFPEENLFQLLQTTHIGCIGPITADTVREYGLTVAVQASVYTIPGFTEAIVEYFGKVVRSQ